MDTRFVNFHVQREIAPVPGPATCRVNQPARFRLHGHAKAKRDRTSGRAHVVEATKEHYLAWRDKMGRQRTGPNGSESAPVRIFAEFGYAPKCAITQADRESRIRDAEPGREPERAARWRQARRTAAEVTRVRVSPAVPDYLCTIHEGATQLGGCGALS